MRDIKDILYEICEDDAVLDPDCELIDSGILDSLAFIDCSPVLRMKGYISSLRVLTELCSRPQEL